MKKMISLLFIASSFSAFAQSSTEKTRILYGICSKDSLIAEPFAKWYNPGYNDYNPNTMTVASLKKQTTDNITIKIFFGSWCGDSKREVPRFLKLLSNMSFPEKRVQLIALGGGDSLVKQSPGHEEAGLGIFRVPTFIIYKNGVEINRINEFPVLSLEKDLLSIFNNQSYTPNYHSFKTVLGWIHDGSLTDDNISARGMAEQVRFLVAGEHELNSLGYLLLKQEKKKEALKLFQINYNLYPESSNIASSFGEGYLENNDPKRAIPLFERSLELNKDPKVIKQLLELLYKAKEKEKS